MKEGGEGGRECLLRKEGRRGTKLHERKLSASPNTEIIACAWREGRGRERRKNGSPSTLLPCSLFLLERMGGEDGGEKGRWKLLALLGGKTHGFWKEVEERKIRLHYGSTLLHFKSKLVFLPCNYFCIQYFWKMWESIMSACRSGKLLTLFDSQEKSVPPFFFHTKVAFSGGEPKEGRQLLRA